MHSWASSIGLGACQAPSVNAVSLGSTKSRVCRPLAPQLGIKHVHTRNKLVTLATKRSSNGAGATKSHKKPSLEEKEELLRNRYFGELFTGGDYSLASKILDPHISHKDMVRDEHYEGIDEVVEYMRKVKETYPGFFVRAAEIAPAPDEDSFFVSFEGHASENLPMFRGVDRIWFTEDGEKIKEVNVYRSNWQGAVGHQKRKRELEEQLRREAEEQQRRG